MISDVLGEAPSLEFLDEILARGGPNSGHTVDDDLEIFFRLKSSKLFRIDLSGDIEKHS